MQGSTGTMRHKGNIIRSFQHTQMKTEKTTKSLQDNRKDIQDNAQLANIP